MVIREMQFCGKGFITPFGNHFLLIIEPLSLSFVCMRLYKLADVVAPLLLIIFLVSNCNSLVPISSQINKCKDPNDL